MSVADDVVALIDRDKLVQFALEICNIDSAGHHGSPDFRSHCSAPWSASSISKPAWPPM